MTIVTVSERGIYGRDHAGKTGVCIAVSAVLQAAARMLDAADLVESAYMEAEPPRYAIEVAEGNVDHPVARAVFAGALATLLEIEKLNGSLLSVTDHRPAPAPSPLSVPALVRPVTSDQSYSQSDAVRREQSATRAGLRLVPGTALGR